ncbi:hypothetical protein EI42_02190 [Thermosporothrix hazakensis]|jgi:hypothetical protein|uniref:Uncharacterized protein n=1 Tax=Thermosporothrix hazakensis TaxID=644383 RepID=A0A326U9K3_THEHA|nr:hypothetical protein [Thermosporothrix hazakensis]PZW31093.1 hypothetical protein EI42_02190 [Thermosporothrix hazakensis]GCE50992.1 hypothetical protein KTH_58610 [Thermosporothrix hazakensis]
MTIAQHITSTVSAILHSHPAIEQHVQGWLEHDELPIEDQKTRTLEELEQEEDAIFTLLANSLFDTSSIN